MLYLIAGREAVFLEYFVIRQVATGFKFDLRAANGEVIATSEVYKTEAACRKGMESVRKNAVVAPVEDQTAGQRCANPKFEIYQDRSGQFRFRLRARNGAIIAVSENYRVKSSCLDTIAVVRACCE